ncbi:MAG: 3'-5' exonuclease [Flammeovirgaceae bacterium]
MHYLDSLNEPQKEAVINPHGAMMIIAGAGSGKTRVLTFRIAFLIENGVEPFNILALTFTNKAAKEMRERIEKLVGNEAKNLWMGTFHSIFAKILRFEGEKLGYSPNFTIYDTDDSKSVLSEVIKDMKLDDKLYRPNSVLSRISNMKNNLISWQMYLRTPEYLTEDEASGRPRIGEIYKEYALRCFKANAMDFDDILFNTNILLRDHLDVLNKYQRKFQYVLIDEFQDTNLSQYLIVKKLSASHQNICVVGDDAQSIYAFRGANIQNILNFEKDYPDLKIVKLEQNYRSTKNIVNAANSVIRYNQAQLKKNIWTSNPEGSKIDLIKSTNDNEEGRLIASSIFEAKVQYGLQNKDFAVLYRTNAQSRAIEENLRRLNITYKVIGGLSFYQRKEVKDMVAYLRFSINPQDIEAFKRIINYPKRGIGDSTVHKLILLSEEKNIPIWEIINNVRTYFQGDRFIKQVEDFALMMRMFMILVEKKDAFAAATQIAKDSGLLQELYADKTVEGKMRYDNLQELLNAIKAYVDNPENEDKSLSAFLQEVSLVSSADTSLDDDAVTLMTIHMSKGLEFEFVYIAGLEENLFPSQMMLESRADLEEERRLFYVAITRAKQKLTLSYALQRYKFGNIQSCEPSRFIEEIDTKFINAIRPYGGFESGFSVGCFGTAKKTNFTRNFINTEEKKTSGFISKPPLKSIGKSFTEFKPNAPDEFQKGQRVMHQKFGEGTILEVEPYGNDKRAKIAFDLNGERTLILSFAKLMILK